ncbi:MULTISPECIES: alpha/beta hydrolase [unclassified Clostridium]|uniref:alpha/beta fold hydrolase n=1 Tax=unclassified Clostridium TaxID=2614128 RepID=UPI0002977507|nr:MULTISPECIES: alpha/beta hydrolase [unclassified Clostridium]EKQ57479.1 MAG: putative hydrolase or acyltransferase of alpha/beta superfamily [Clostridium sp. Maddingley MBC34-26]
MEKEGYITFDNSKLFYSVKGEGKPLIFIHGNFNDSRVWRYQVESFSSQYKVISYDQRGYGKSDTPTSTFSHFEDLKVILDSLEIKSAVIIGSSSGGSIAIDFALKYPDYVDALILASPAVNGYRYPLKLIIEAMKSISLLKSKGFEAAIEKFINSSFWSYFIPDQSNEKARKLILETIRTQKNFYSWNFKLAVPEKPYAAKRLGEIHIPTLIVLGNRDFAFNVKVGERLHAGIESSDKITISDCGHLPFVEKYEEFNKQICKFLKQRNL